MEDQEKILKYLCSVEKQAEEIISDKKEIINLDKKRNHNREALRGCLKVSQGKCWVTVGSVLVKHNVSQAVILLENEQRQLNIDINKLRSDLKEKVNNLRDLEMQPPVAGLSLVPMSKHETESFKTAGIF